VPPINQANLALIVPPLNLTGSKAKIRLFGSYGDNRPITDPYYGGSKGFEKAYQQCLKYSQGLLEDLGFGDSKTDEKKGS
jgi:low molecular weight phosphotyrosine protein phosphatase